MMAAIHMQPNQSWLDHQAMQAIAKAWLPVAAGLPANVSVVVGRCNSEKRVISLHQSV